MTPLTPELEPEALPPEDQRPAEGAPMAPVQARGGFLGRMRALVTVGALTALPLNVGAQQPAQPANPPPAERANDPKKEPTNEEIILPKADFIGEKIAGAETRGRWLPIFQEILKDVPDFRERKVRLGQTELEFVYNKLNEDRQNLARALRSMSAMQAGQELSSLNKDKSGYNIARYLKERGEYLQILELPVAVPVPDFLAKHIEISARDRATFEVTRRMIRMQYHIADRADLGIGKSPRELSDDAAAIALRAIQRRNLKVSDLRACTTANTDEGYRLFLRKCDVLTPTDDDLRAMRLLGAYVMEREPIMQKSLKFKKKPSVDELTIGEALETMHDGGAGDFLNEMVNEIKKQSIMDVFMHPVDMAQVLEKVSAVSNMFSEETTALIIDGLGSPEQIAAAANVREYTPEQYAADVALVHAFMRNTNASTLRLRDIQTNMGTLTSTQRQIVLLIQRSIMQESTVDRLLAAAFLPQGAENQELRGKMREALLKRVKDGEMTTKESFELFYWLNAPLNASILTASKLISVVEKDDYKTANDYRVYLVGLVRKIATSDPSKIGDLLPGLSENQKQSLSDTSRYLQDEGIDKIYNLSDRIAKLVLANPWLLLFIPATWVVLRKTGTVALYWSTWRSSGRLGRFLSMEGPDLRAFMAEHGLQDVDMPTVLAAQAELRKIDQDMDNKKSWAWDRPWLRRKNPDSGNLMSRIFNRSVTPRAHYLAQSNAVIEAAKTGKLAELAKALKPRCANAAHMASILQSAARTPAELQAVLEAAGYTADESRIAAEGVVRTLEMGEEIATDINPDTSSSSILRRAPVGPIGETGVRTEVQTPLGSTASGPIRVDPATDTRPDPRTSTDGRTDVKK
jgi:hypothetical protein